MVTFKAGVEFNPLAFGGIRILLGLKKISNVIHKDIVITSGTDGTHSGPDDPHKHGNAFDIRTHNLTISNKYLLLDQIRAELGIKFYAFLEDPNLSNEHIHIQVARGLQFGINDFLNV